MHARCAVRAPPVLRGQSTLRIPAASAGAAAQQSQGPQFPSPPPGGGATHIHDHAVELAPLGNDEVHHFAAVVRDRHVHALGAGEHPRDELGVGLRGGGGARAREGGRERD